MVVVGLLVVVVVGLLVVGLLVVGLLVVVVVGFFVVVDVDEVIEANMKALIIRNFKFIFWIRKILCTNNL